MIAIDLKMAAVIIVLIIAIAAFFYQIHKMWKARVTMKNFLLEIKKLNSNLENIITYIQGVPSSGKKNKGDQKICKNCIFRLTYVDPDSPKVFFYQCKLDKRKISLKDTCKRFQKDLQNTQI